MKNKTFWQFIKGDIGTLGTLSFLTFFSIFSFTVITAHSLVGGIILGIFLFCIDMLVLFIRRQDWKEIYKKK